MKRKYFGTDGVRGVSNELLTPEFVTRLGVAAGRWLARQEMPQRALLGCDTRRSGSMLTCALASGLCSAGVDAVNVGVAPTGAISYLARTQGFGMACVVSASHNPAPDNGIKLIASKGSKVTDDDEFEIEQLMEEEWISRPMGGGIGVFSEDPNLLDLYCKFLISLAPNRLDGLKLVMDCANGAAYRVAPIVFQELGAELIAIGTEPNGNNINDECGATHTMPLQFASKKYGAHAGIAFDGDADRCVLSDSQGRLFNGDRIMALWAKHHKDQLNPPTVVGTVMSNGAMANHLEGIGISLTRVSVGDKYVAEKLDQINGKIGGEQSGHIIFSDYGVTGDGLLTALEVLKVIRADGKQLADYFNDYDPMPQVMHNVRLSQDIDVSTNEVLNGAISSAEELDKGKIRVSVRKSGTEPMLRVMVESQDQTMRDKAAELIVNCLRSNFGIESEKIVELTHALGN